MRIFRDENQTHHYLASLLKKAGHVVSGTIDAGMAGASDARQFRHAIEYDVVLLTGDELDFRELHELVLVSGGRHPGVMVISAEKDSSKKMKPKHIVAAIGNLERAAFVMESQLVVLNQWR